MARSSEPKSKLVSRRSSASGFGVRFRWLAAGTAFGVAFPLIGWLVASPNLTLSGITAGHASQPVLYIVDLAPLVLGITGYAIGVFHARLIRIRRSIEDTVRERTAELQHALQDLSNTQADLLNSQKLEAIGGLAAGIAHEINTPIQYVSDNTRFVEESFAGLLDVVSAAGALVETVQGISEAAAPVDRFQRAADDADIDYLAEEVPTALAESLTGIEQVAEIVRALKSFAHPGGKEKAPTNLNELISATVAVSRSQWKLIAEMDLSGLDPELPEVPALAGPLKQVILNMFINAAHAIEPVHAATGVMGTIAVGSRVEGDWAVITIADTGTGIPEEIRDRVFEPFFTTKEVGQGSGQGLAIAKSMVDKHGGEIGFAGGPNGGTIFTIRLPLAQIAAPNVESAA